MKGNFLTILMIALSFIIWSKEALSNDLDDGINAEDIKNSDSIKKDLNISYFVRSAKGRAAAGTGRTKKSLNSEEGDATMGSAIVKEGARVDGPLIVIFEGDRNTVVNKE